MLVSFRFPATFFVISDAIARAEEFWWDEFKFIFRAPGFNFETAGRLLTRHSVTWPSESTREHGAPLGYSSLWRFLRDLPPEKRRQYFRDLRDQMGLQSETCASHRPMTASELRTLAANPLFEIGGHTVTHPSLPTLNEVEQEKEIVSGSRFLEAMLGNSIRSFSYPFGDWKPVTREIVLSAGFECALTAQHRPVRTSDDQFTLPRWQVVS